MKRIALLTILMVSVVFLVPTYAGKPAKEPPGIKVSDSQGNPLGVLIRHEPRIPIGSGWDIQIFIPSMGMFINALGYDVRIIGSTTAHETYDCTGEAFIDRGPPSYGQDHLYYDYDLAKAYRVVPRVGIVVHSYLQLDTRECRPTSDPAGDSIEAWPLIEIAPEDLLIPLPLQMPLSYEY